jgi:hypothetical protein
MAAVVDSETLVAQTQDRLWRALKRRYQYDSSLKDSQGFLLNNVNSKISLVIMYADLVGSTNMSIDSEDSQHVLYLLMCSNVQIVYLLNILFVFYCITCHQHHQLN